MIKWPFGHIFYVRRRKPSQPDTPEIARQRAQAKATLPARLAELAARHGFVYNKVFIKNNRSNWGSCSSLKNINLNLRLVTLPQELQDLVMLHELCHLKYLNHSAQFHALLESVCPGHRALEKRLKQYKIR
ncbi:MAG: M48 family metallopeptidase [Bacteroidales bacterium]|nr:M48 family metallopeptidase [Bacteroidales bacterium]